MVKSRGSRETSMIAQLDRNILGPQIEKLLPPNTAFILVTVPFGVDTTPEFVANVPDADAISALRELVLAALGYDGSTPSPIIH